MEIKGQTGNVFKFVSGFIKEKGRPPTLREISSETGLKSTWTVRYHLKKLAEAGYIKLRTGLSRGIEVLKKTGGVPLVGRISAGKPVDAIENIEGYIDSIPDFIGAAGMFALRVSGDSMEGEGIMDGDIVFIKKQDRAEKGQIVAALLDGEATVKKYSLTKEGVKLTPANPGYRPIVSKDVKILGRVVGVVRKYR